MRLQNRMRSLPGTAERKQGSRRLVQQNSTRTGKKLPNLKKEMPCCNVERSCTLIFFVQTYPCIPYRIPGVKMDPEPS